MTCKHLWFPQTRVYYWIWRRILENLNWPDWKSQKRDVFKIRVWSNLKLVYLTYAPFVHIQFRTSMFKMIDLPFYPKRMGEFVCVECLIKTLVVKPFLLSSFLVLHRPSTPQKRTQMYYYYWKSLLQNIYIALFDEDAPHNMADHLWEGSVVSTVTAETLLASRIKST